MSKIINNFLTSKEIQPFRILRKFNSPHRLHIPHNFIVSLKYIKMKNRIISVYAGFSIILALFFVQPCQAQIWKKIKNKVEQETTDQIIDDVGKTTDKAIDNTEHQGERHNNESDNNSSAKTDESGGPSNPSGPSIKSYQNYDFVPGNTILFADDFTEDQDGEFPAHWNLESGQAVVNKVGGKPAFFLTDGNYCKVTPKMKNASYLTDPFTIEFDTYTDGNGDESPVLFLEYTDNYGNTEDGTITFNRGDSEGRGDVSTSGFPSNGFSADMPNALKENYVNHWHHCAVIYKNDQLKCYVDQYRVLTVPNLKCVPTAFGFEGVGDQDTPIMITDIRVAAGGQMNILGKKFTESKIVTHGINFDVDKATLKPESMGTLNMIVQVLKDNPDLKFEIDGYTDSTGQAAHNLSLSQQRSEAVKAQLVQMGIDGSRLSSKGFGDKNPIDDNATLAGRANNRRVEFVKV